MSLSSEEESQSELDTWKQAHEVLVNAVIVAKEAVAAKKAQRRFWLEEICANLTNDGKLATTSVWNRPTLKTKRAAKPKPETTKKRKAKKPAEPKAKRPKKKGKDGEQTAVAGKPAKPKIRLKLTKTKKEVPKTTVVSQSADQYLHDPERSHSPDHGFEPDPDQQDDSDQEGDGDTDEHVHESDHSVANEWGSSQQSMITSTTYHPHESVRGEEPIQPVYPDFAALRYRTGDDEDGNDDGGDDDSSDED